MTRADHVRTALRQPMNCRQSGTNSKIIDDDSIRVWTRHRDIEVRSDKDPFPSHVTEILKRRNPRHGLAVPSNVEDQIDESI